MGRKLGLTRAQVVEAAAEIADRDGLDALSLASVASALGVRSPSLYSHVDGLTGLLDALTLAVTAEFGETLRDSVVGVSGDDAVAVAR